MSLKAVGLISGGLDSALAAKVIRLQGIEVLGLNFVTPFTQKFKDSPIQGQPLESSQKFGESQPLEKLAQNMDIQIKAIDISVEYLDLIKNPSFGFGRNLNPCIDCHIFMLKKAKEVMLEHKADFIITGEVLGQRPMSQNKSALRKIEKESGLEGLLLRPLSAQLLNPTIPEEDGRLKRNRLLGFSGRSRKPQMELARQLGLEGFSQPAGGCLLTDPGFSQRLRDLLNYQPEFNLADVQLLKLGRHFRLSRKVKLVIGRNQQENQYLINLIPAGNIVLKPVDIPGPTGIISSKSVSRELLELSAGMLARYCDQGKDEVRVSIENNGSSRIINCHAVESEILDRLRI